MFSLSKPHIPNLFRDLVPGSSKETLKQVQGLRSLTKGSI